MAYFPIRRTLRGVCGAFLLLCFLFAPQAKNSDRGSEDLTDIKFFIAMSTLKCAGRVAFLPESPRVDRYTEVIDMYGEKFRLGKRVVASIIFIECRFQWWRTSPAGCVGPMQVSPGHWKHLCYSQEIDNGHLAAYLRAKGITNPRRYMRRIGYGTELGCYILRFIMDQYDYEYERALIVYAYKDGLQKARSCNSPYEYQYVRDVMEVRSRI